MTKTYTLTDGKTVKVYARRKGEGARMPGGRYDIYAIIFQTGDGKASATFHNSQARYGVPLTPADVDDAVNCCMLDATAYLEHQTVRDFADTYCFDDTRLGEASRIWKSCGRLADRLGRLLTDDEMYELLNITSE